MNKIVKSSCWYLMVFSTLYHAQNMLSVKFFPLWSIQVISLSLSLLVIRLDLLGQLIRRHWFKIFLITYPWLIGMISIINLTYIKWTGIHFWIMMLHGIIGLFGLFDSEGQTRKRLTFLLFIIIAALEGFFVNINQLSGPM